MTELAKNCGPKFIDPNLNQFVDRCQRCHGKGYVKVGQEFQNLHAPSIAPCGLCGGRGWNLNDYGTELMNLLREVGVPLRYPESDFAQYPSQWWRE